MLAPEDPCLSFFDLDIALVSLPKLFQFNEYVKPICLPNNIKAIRCALHTDSIIISINTQMGVQNFSGYPCSK